MWYCVVMGYPKDKVFMFLYIESICRRKIKDLSKSDLSVVNNSQCVQIFEYACTIHLLVSIRLWDGIFLAILTLSHTSPGFYVSAVQVLKTQ